MVADMASLSHEDTGTSSGHSGRVLLCAEHLHKAFGGQVVLNRLSLKLHRGEVVLLRGDNGSGKTTLLNILTGNLEPDAGGIHLFTNDVAERFQFPRHWWQDLNPFDHFTPERVASEGVGRTWQEVRLFSTQTLLENVAVSHPQQDGENPWAVLLRNGAVRRQEAETQTESLALLEKFGLGERSNSSADMVSLGQAKRVAIARAIQAGAKILFLDEPLAGLDAQGIGNVMALLQQLAQEHKITLVIVEHVFNIPRVLKLANTVWTLANGKITVQNPVEIAVELASNHHQGIEQLINSLAGDQGQRAVRHQALPGGAMLTTICRGGAEDSEPIFELEDLVVKRGNRLVIGERKEDGQIQGLSLRLNRSELAFLQAPNGWGKTTLLKAILGLLPIVRGRIRLNSVKIENLPVWQRVKLGLQFLQSDNYFFPNLSVREALRLGRSSEPPAEFRELLPRRVSALSGGERQKVSLHLLLSEGGYLILDEPFSCLDENQISRLLKNLVNERTKVLLIAVPSSTTVKRGN